MRGRPGLTLHAGGHHVSRARFPGRHIHLTTEDNRNITDLHERSENGEATRFTGEWNDDFHNAAHVIATGETEGYYGDFAEAPLDHLARCLTEGFSYQGEVSRHAGGTPQTQYACSAVVLQKLLLRARKLDQAAPNPVFG